MQLTDLLAYFSSKPHKYEFESITEIAPVFPEANSNIPLSIPEEVAELPSSWSAGKPSSNFF